MDDNSRARRRTLTRRRTLAAIASAGAIGSAAAASAARGRALYLALGRSDGARLGRLGRFLGGSDPDAVRRRIERAGFSVRHSLADGRVLVIAGPAGERGRLGRVRGVRLAVDNRRFRIDLSDPLPAAPGAPAETGGASVTDDEFYPRQWDKQLMDVPAASDVATGEGRTIAVIDSGVDAEHPDIAPNFDLGASRRFNDGRILPSLGRDPVGHGTFVASVAAASADGRRGVVGVAPDATVVSLRVVDPKEENAVLTLVDLIVAMGYAATRGFDAINLSLGVLVELPPAVVRTLRVAADYIVATARPESVGVIASGNDGVDVRDRLFDFPGSVRDALTVGATGPNDRRTFYSTYGRGYVDVGAPGGGYETRYKTLHAGPENDDDRIDDPEKPGVEWPHPTNLIYGALPTRGPNASDEPYGYRAGTSFAAPQVAGLVALVREVAPNLPAGEVQRMIAANARSIPGETPAELGAGRVAPVPTLEAVCP